MDAPMIALVAAGIVIVALSWFIHRQGVRYDALLKTKREVDDKCASLLKQRDAAEERRAFMAEKFDPLFDSMKALRERHSDALNEMHAEIGLHRQRAITLCTIIERLLPETALSDARKRMILQEIEPATMMTRFAQMYEGGEDGETERSAAEGA